MDAVLKLNANEFSEEIVKKLKFLMPNDDYTITISISDDNNKEFYNKIDNAINSLQNNEGTQFTLKTFEEFIKNN